ncbi:protein Z, vitamin K-dependent plasma glycoprotein a [Corythoichthys intestinalis]|uniref:protein Z, vitamin K-dependent plasma glycoprotein a n=1 Tax=Corythoichthys intestinalis TaxID=161448 RepID=UPI0025A5BEAB|nr:protein Z, vitamin K-dependent plasma glycoprotein a [Corythoichthys intestinalis]XP_057673970.1 protein Z, vitamin K-dependent plasma glycoprotein a [Corythoichthys intestinalis]XP_061805469.1 coagulation factor X-like [Nerophis lumbriciformis]
MRPATPFGAVVCLLAGAVAALHSPPQTVFLDKQQASSLIWRPKRSVDGTSQQPASLEQACMERVCKYEEARKHFPDSYRTDIFWAVYVDGDQCAEKPCKNGALCSDSVGGYDCVCKAGFSGVHCETDQTVCVVEKKKGCSQFCKPGYTSYECSCARGWKLHRTDKDKCEPAVRYPCGKVISLSHWEDRQATIVRSDFQPLDCTSVECPWQALLKSTQSEGFCSGVIIKENLVLTSAQCASKYDSFQVAVGKRKVTSEDSEQTALVKVVHPHPRYVPGRPDNDLAVVELLDRIIFKREVTAVCLPEKDFADSVLTSGDLPAVVTGWKDPQPPASSFQGSLTLNQLAYKSLPQCLEMHPNLMSNKMGCTAARANADCSVGSGSPLLTLYREVFFLTGVVSQPEGSECSKGFIFQKVSRHLDWLQSLMASL